MTDRWLGKWRHFWFQPAPPHIFALLRIALGIVGLVHIAGSSDIGAYWASNGLIRFDSHPWLSARLAEWGLQWSAGAMLFGLEFAIFTAMIVGFRSDVAVPLGLVAGVVQLWWNRLPLSGAFQLWLTVMFCLIWSQTGGVWSVDQWLAKRAADKGDLAAETLDQPVWPLRLIQYQVALLYLVTALWKVLDPVWQDGSALHYILSGTMYPRFAAVPPASFDGILVGLTYATLLWELAFPFLLIARATRTLALVSGVIVHAGMWGALEIGPFSLVIVATYLAFLDPRWFAGRRLDEEIRSRGVFGEKCSPSGRLPSRDRQDAAAKL